MNWVLYILIGYFGEHSTMTEHGQFKTEKQCQEVAKIVQQQKPTSRFVTHTFCLPREKNT